MPDYPLASSETELNIGATRYSSLDFPPYRYVPGLHPHPTNSPDGHSYGEEDEESGNKMPVAKMTTVNSLTAKASAPSIGTSIAARTDRFTIQITSKKMLKDAQLFSQKLISKGYDAYIQKVVFKTDEIWYRVRVGSYDNHNSAKAAADDLSGELGMATWVDFVRKEQ